MITIDEYVKPKSAAEAYALLTTRENPAVVGGGVFMRLASRKVGVAIDLCQAGLDFIREGERQIEIGAMTTISRLISSQELQQNFDRLIPTAMANLPGVQLRNMVTVGGTIWGKYGFSELLTCLMVFDCKVALHHGGILKLADFLAQNGKEADIIEKIVIEKEPLRASYQMFRNSAGSLPILTVAVSKGGNAFKIAVGGRPGVATPAYEAMDYLNRIQMNDETVEKAAVMAAGELSFSNDRRASGEYRRALCKTLVKRAVLEVEK
jgi:CO/xanthine dehydrogenase FAD-binding subunit